MATRGQGGQGGGNGRQTEKKQTEKARKHSLQRHGTSRRPDARRGVTRLGEETKTRIAPREDGRGTLRRYPHLEETDVRVASRRQVLLIRCDLQLVHREVGSAPPRPPRSGWVFTADARRSSLDTARTEGPAQPSPHLRVGVLQGAIAYPPRRFPEPYGVVVPCGGEHHGGVWHVLNCLSPPANNVLSRCACSL